LNITSTMQHAKQNALIEIQEISASFQNRLQTWQTHKVSIEKNSKKDQRLTISSFFEGILRITLMWDLKILESEIWNSIVQRREGPCLAEHRKWTTTLFCLISVGYHLKLHVAKKIYRHCHFYQLSYSIFSGVHTIYLCYLYRTWYSR
jgi:hypothetical protein